MKDWKHTCQSQGVCIPESPVPYRQAISFIVVIRMHNHQKDTLPFDSSAPHAISETGITFGVRWD